MDLIGDAVEPAGRHADVRGVRISLSGALARLPLAATDCWPDGVWDTEAFAHGSMSVVAFAPRGVDRQTSHAQDELYVVVAGSGVLVVRDERVAFVAGDALFVPANIAHHFEDFTADLVTWAMFWGPRGGEVAAGSDR